MTNSFAGLYLSDTLNPETSALLREIPRLVYIVCGMRVLNVDSQ